MINRNRSAFSIFAILLVFLLNHSFANADNVFEHAFTIEENVGSFGRGLGEFNGNLLVGSTSSAFQYDVETGEILQEYLNAGGIFNSGGWIDGFGNSIAVGNAGGTVNIFDADTGQLSQTLSGQAAGNSFGQSVASNGAQLFVGDPQRRSGLTFFGQGRVDVFDQLGNRSTIENPEPGTSQALDSESFGNDVEVINNDLYVGAIFDTDGGKVWQYAADTGSLIREFSNPDGSLGNGGRPQFGNSLDVSNDFVLVGANQSSASGVNASGAAYLFDRNTGELLHRFFDPELGVLDNFGSEVALLNQYAIVGAHVDGGVNAVQGGSVFVFDTFSGDLLQTIQTPNASSDFFGLEITTIGSSHLAISETTGNGIVHVFSIPEPNSAFLLCAGLLMTSARRRRS